MAEYKECPKHLDEPDSGCIECMQNLRDYCSDKSIKLIGDENDLLLEPE